VGAGIAVLCLLPTVLGRWPVAAPRMAVGELRRMIMASATRPYQGYVDSQGQAGLPSLPQVEEVAGLLGGATSIRVWYAAPTAWRVAVVHPLGERDTYRTADGIYQWDFARNLLVRSTGDLPVRLPWATDLVPPELARRLLTGMAADDRVDTLPARRVAGVSAAGLRIRPADPDTTVGAVDIWADPSTGLPVEVAVRPRSAGAPAMRTRFLDLAQRTPVPATVAPAVTDPAQVPTITEPDVLAALSPEASAALPDRLAGRQRLAGDAGGAAIPVYGSGLSRFVVVPLPGRLGSQSVSAVRNAGGASTTVPGGEVYPVPAGVLTVVVVQRASGRRGTRTFLLAGLIRPDALVTAARDLLAARPDRP
jgi:hypothetical protein